MAYTFNHTLCIYLFVLRIFIDYPQQGYNYSLKTNKLFDMVFEISIGLTPYFRLKAVQKWLW